MTYYRRLGEVPPKRHTQFRRPDGGLYSEELMGQHGFSGDSSLLYHLHQPSEILDVEALPGGKAELVDNWPLLPRHLKTAALATGDDPVTGRHLMLGNRNVTLSVVSASRASGLYRNAVGDELWFVRSGQARLESVFGAVECGRGDYVVVPQSTTHRWVPAGDGPFEALVLEAAGHVGPPSRYLSDRGRFLEHAPYCERDLHGPDRLVHEEGESVAVLVRHAGGLTRYTYAHHPFDVVGWDGSVYPYRFSIHDFEPITGRVHQPPPVHQTFAGPGFVVCSFVPRKLDYHPLSVPAPYSHANTDSDEVLYYVEGQFTSRLGAGIEVGSISLHPAGFVHGPQPGSVEASLGRESTDEAAVMVDTFAPLQLGPAALEVEDPAYPWSWRKPGPKD